MNVAVLILGMMAVTYIPRALPAALIEKMRFSPRTERFLRLIPYTAMTALIFPGILGVDADRAWIGVVGGLVAFVLGIRKMPILVSILGAIACVFLSYVCFG